MSKSVRLRVDDLRSLHRLVDECRDLGDDALRWRGHFAARLGPMVGAGLVIFGELPTGPVPPRRVVGEAVWGWGNGFDQAGYRRLVAEMAARTGFFNPMYGPYESMRGREDGVALSRPDLVRDAEWERSEYVRDYHRPVGCEVVLYCYRSIPGDPFMTSGFILARRTGERDFSARAKAVVREANVLVTPLLGGPLSRFGEPSPVELPPRVRQVLRCLLEGDGDKQVARRLGISPHTVNQYAKTIFVHFGVQSRSELLARWVRRGWGGRFAWADE